jgi:hypothetical protein
VRWPLDWDLVEWSRIEVSAVESQLIELGSCETVAGQEGREQGS